MNPAHPDAAERAAVTFVLTVGAELLIGPAGSASPSWRLFVQQIAREEIVLRVGKGRCAAPSYTCRVRRCDRETPIAGGVCARLRGTSRRGAEIIFTMPADVEIRRTAAESRT